MRTLPLLLPPAGPGMLPGTIDLVQAMAVAEVAGQAVREVIVRARVALVVVDGGARQRLKVVADGAGKIRQRQRVQHGLGESR